MSKHLIYIASNKNISNPTKSGTYSSVIYNITIIGGQTIKNDRPNTPVSKRLIKNVVVVLQLDKMKLSEALTTVITE